MRLKFIKNYKSIEEFKDVELNNFTIFLGINGAGKTHLLKSIQEGINKVDEIAKDNISYFNLQTFLIKNQKSVALRGIDEEKLQAWNLFEIDKAIYETFDTSIKALIGEKENPYNRDVAYVQKSTYNLQIKNILHQINYRTKNIPRIGKLIKTAVFESEKYCTQLTKEEFFKNANYDPSDYELLESLSEIFIDYQKKLVISALSKKDGGLGLDDTKITELKEKAPWNFINRMFTEFNLNHKVAEPKFTVGDIINSYSIPFQVKLLIDKIEVDFDDLSSGEKILCALAITVYQNNKSKFPELLLLDEVDASLHPAMIKNLLDVINNIFVKRNCNVIFATHSPTTIAMASEDSLFEVKKGKEIEKIIKISQKDAINILSEGIMTFEKGLKIQKSIDDSKKLQILTEGNNTSHIKKAITLLNPELLEKINLIEASPDRRGQQLKNVFDVMSKASWTENFLFIWDCDNKEMVNNLIETRNFKKYCFLENKNNSTAKDKNGNPIGIENLYPDELFTHDVYNPKIICESYGEEIFKKEFDKRKFLDKIELQNDPSVFINFQDMIKKIKELTS